MKTLEQAPAPDTSDTQNQKATNAQFNDIMTQEFGDDTLFITPVVAREEPRELAVPEVPTLPTTEPTPSLTTEAIDVTEHEAPEAKQSFVRRALGRLSLSRLGAEMTITQLNIAEKSQTRREKSRIKNEAHEDDGRLTRARKFLGRNALALVAGVGSIAYVGSRLYGIEMGMSRSTSIDYQTAATITNIDSGTAINNPIFVGGHTQGSSNALPDASRQAGVANFNGAPRKAVYNAEIGGIVPGDRQTMTQSGDQAKNAILAQARPGDRVVAHSEGTLGAIRAAEVRPDLKVDAYGSPYAPGSGMLSGNSPANSKTVSPILGALGVPTGHQGPANGRNITYHVNDGGAANGGRGTGDVWTASVDPDGTFNPVRVGSNALGTAYLGTHDMSAHSGTPYKVTTNPDGSTTKHYNSGTRVNNPMTGKPYESGYTAVLQKNHGVSTPANLDRALKLAEGDANGNINARAVGDAVAPGLGNVAAPFQPLIDATIKPAQQAIMNPTPQNINKVVTGVTQNLGGGSAPAANKNIPAPAAAPVPKLNIPTPQQVQADPVGAAFKVFGSVLGGAPR